MNEIENGFLSSLIFKNLLNKEDAPRDYIGASSIGHPCQRYIWYGYNGYKSTPYSPRQKLTFLIGKQLELMTIQLLIESGLNIIYEENELKDKDNKKFRGHFDVLWIVDESRRIIIELKTANDASYRNFVKNTTKRWNEMYYAQLQSYMGMSGVHEAIIFVENKNTSETFDRYETFDEGYYQTLQTKAQKIIDSSIVPMRLYSNPTFQICRGCKFKEECFAE